MSSASRPLRRDAERNRRRILEAARDVFAERGLAATLDDVAAHAGVGVGTVYRRFADKDALVDELFEDRIAAMAALAERHLADPDPWAALCGFLEEFAALQAADRGLRDLVHHPDRGRERVQAARERLAPSIRALLVRAQDAGVVRADLDVTDLGMITLTLVTVIDSTQDVRTDAWRRHLALSIDAIRPAAAVDALPGPPLTLAEFDDALRAAPT